MTARTLWMIRQDGRPIGKVWATTKVRALMAARQGDWWEQWETIRPGTVLQASEYPAGENSDIRTT